MVLISARVVGQPGTERSKLTNLDHDDSVSWDSALKSADSPCIVL